MTDSDTNYNHIKIISNYQSEIPNSLFRQQYSGIVDSSSQQNFVMLSVPLNTDTNASMINFNFHYNGTFSLVFGNSH